jgi:hypothetical protein
MIPSFFAPMDAACASRLSAKYLLRADKYVGIAEATLNP